MKHFNIKNLNMTNIICNEYIKILNDWTCRVAHGIANRFPKLFHALFLFSIHTERDFLSYYFPRHGSFFA